MRQFYRLSEAGNVSMEGKMRKQERKSEISIGTYQNVLINKMLQKGKGYEKNRP